jgi:hypothetical protein
VVMCVCVCERERGKEGGRKGGTWRSCVEANACLILSGSGREMKMITGLSRSPECPLYKLAPIMYIYSESHFAVW